MRYFFVIVTWDVIYKDIILHTLSSFPIPRTLSSPTFPPTNTLLHLPLTHHYYFINCFTKLYIMDATSSCQNQMLPARSAETQSQKQKLTIPAPFPSVFLPFIRMHQLSTLLHFQGATKPVSEDQFQELVEQYNEKGPLTIRSTTTVTEHMCTHRRHPAILQAIQDGVTDRYAEGSLYPVCSIQAKFAEIVELRKQLVRNVSFHYEQMVAATQHDYEIEDEIERIRLRLDDEMLLLERLARMELNWETVAPMYFCFSASAAIAIMEYESGQRDDRKDKTEVPGRVRTEN